MFTEEQREQPVRHGPVTPVVLLLWYTPTSDPHMISRRPLRDSRENADPAMEPTPGGPRRGSRET